MHYFFREHRQCSVTAGPMKVVYFWQIRDPGTLRGPLLAYCCSLAVHRARASRRPSASRAASQDRSPTARLGRWTRAPRSSACVSREGFFCKRGLKMDRGPPLRRRCPAAPIAAFAAHLLFRPIQASPLRAPFQVALFFVVLLLLLGGPLVGREAPFVG